MTERKRRPRGRGQALTPGEFESQTKALIDELAYLNIAYRWTHASAYGKAVTGDGAGVRAGVTNTTQDIATSNPRDTLRYSLKVAGSDLVDALAEVKSATYILDRAIMAVDPAPSPNLRHADQYRQSRQELADARAAKERRIERGEGWGDG